MNAGAVWVFVAASSVAALAGAPLVQLLRRAGIRQTVSENAPERHAGKQGTPTMGGLIILAGFTVAFLATAPTSREAWAAWCLVMVFGAIGFLDDALIVARGKNLGLRAREKLALQVVATVLFAALLHAWRGIGQDTEVLGLRLGAAYYPLAVLLIVGLGNAANLADGLDGLNATMCMIICLGLPFMVSTDALGAALAATSFALAGGCAGFLFYNVHPAQVMMGDTGSLALGAGIGALCVLGRCEAPSQLAAAVLWVETLSVMAQVTVFKWRKRQQGIEHARAHRLFRRTPIHHHFEELGWPETRVVGRFALVTALTTGAAIAWSMAGRASI